MEINNYNTITSKQASTLIVATQIGIGMQVLPSAVVEKAGHDGWISVFLVGILLLVSGLFYLSLSKRFSYHSILDITKAVSGKLIAFIINTLLLLSLLFILIGNYSLFVAGVGIWFFRSTPNWALAIYLMVPSVYLVCKGLKSIARFSFLLYLIIPLIMCLVLLNLRDFRLTALLPLFENGLTGIFKAMPTSLFAFSGFEILLFITPNIKGTEKLSRRISAAAMISTLMFIIVIIASVGIFGEDFVVKRFNALLGLARLIKLPVIERVDLYFLAVWITGMTLVINSFLFLVCDTAQRIFKYKAKLTPILIITTIVVASVSFIEDNILVLKFSGMTGYVSFFVGVLIPIIIYITAVLRNKRAGDIYENP